MNDSDSRRNASRQRLERRLLAKVEQTIIRYDLLRPGDKVLIACSGGPDSMALLEALVRLQERRSLRLALAHFNHLLRLSAADDESFAAEQARRLGLPFYLGREDVRAHAADNGLNLEEAGRERRYEFLRKTAARVGANRIATGHTLNDQAETVILRLLRGTGPTGLRGIAPSVEGLIIRPLLAVERGEIEDWLRAEGIPWREDESNRDRRFLRNRVRLDLIPYLKRDFEPAVVRQLGRLADICREEEAARRPDRTTPAVAVSSLPGEIGLEAAGIVDLPVAEARRRVREFLRGVRGDLRRLSLSDIEAVRRLGEHKEHRLPGGPVLRREGGLIRVFGKQQAEPPAAAAFHHVWDGRGELRVEGTGPAFRAEIRPRAEAGDQPSDDSSRAQVDADKIAFPLVVRTRKEGDRYQPLGAPGRKKLKEILRARRVPLAERDRLPVFISDGKIVWVPGLPVADAFKITPVTRTVLILRKA